jgi:hypothetical protein
MNYADGPTCIDQNPNSFTNAANAAATSAGYSPSSYGFVVYLFHGMESLFRYAIYPA